MRQGLGEYQKWSMGGVQHKNIKDDRSDSEDYIHSLYNGAHGVIGLSSFDDEGDVRECPRLRRNSYPSIARSPRKRRLSEIEDSITGAGILPTSSTRPTKFIRRNDGQGASEKMSEDMLNDDAAEANTSDVLSNENVPRLLALTRRNSYPSISVPLPKKRRFSQGEGELMLKMLVPFTLVHLETTKAEQGEEYKKQSQLMLKHDEHQSPEPNKEPPPQTHSTCSQTDIIQLHEYQNSHPVSEQEESSVIIFNDEETTIRLHPTLASCLREHQIDALRFLWAEIAVAPISPKEVPDIQNVDGKEVVYPPSVGSGVLLAHTMGLGKTVTVIAFLFTLARAQGFNPSKTANPSLPYHLRMGTQKPRILIIVPGSLSSNWLLELETWAAKFPMKPRCPGRTLLKSVYSMGGIVALDERIEILTTWRERGGILLMGHELFRALVSPKRAYSRTGTQQNEINWCLLEPGPDIVIADEAHAFKTHNSKVTKAVKKIKTRSRIALTASPLSNNLLEFWCLMSWVWPNSGIGMTARRFREKYMNKITRAGFDGVGKPAADELDSSSENDNMMEDEEMATEKEVTEDIDNERRLAENALKRIIAATSPKIHRRNVDIIRKYLKPKTEFIIRISLTSRQTSMYNRFLGSSEGSTSVWRYFVLRALCNHPDVFRKISRREAAGQIASGGEKKKYKGKEVENLLGETYTSNDILLGKASDPTTVNADVRERRMDSSEQESIEVTQEIERDEDMEDEADLIDMAQSENEDGDADDDSDYDGLGEIFKDVEDADIADNGGADDEGDSIASTVKSTAEVSMSPSTFISPPSLASIASINTRKLSQATVISRAQHAINQSPKFRLLFHLLYEFRSIGDHTILFSHSIDTLSYLYTLARLLGFTCLRLDGSISFSQRAVDIATFNQGTHNIYFVSTKAGGVGLNLQCANRVVVLDNDHSPVWEQQAIGRSYRLGQMKEVYVYRFLVEATLETRIAREKWRKVKLADLVIDGRWTNRVKYEREGDHRKAWERAQVVRPPKELGGIENGGWRGRDKVLDKVVPRVKFITEIIVDRDGTTAEV